MGIILGIIHFSYRIQKEEPETWSASVPEGLFFQSTTFLILILFDFDPPPFISFSGVAAALKVHEAKRQAQNPVL